MIIFARVNRDGERPDSLEEFAVFIGKPFGANFLKLILKSFDCGAGRRGVGGKRGVLQIDI